jgi:hypothetical protein
VSLKEGTPFYIAGILLIGTGSVFLLYFGMGYYTLMSILAFISAGLIFYVGWMQHFGKDNKEYDKSSGGKRVFLPPS